MAWEERHGNQYYYHKKWINGTCVSEYFGRGELAEAIADIDQLDRQRQWLEREEWRQQQAEIGMVDRRIDEVCTAIKTVTRAVLRVTGHHTHKGQWRKRRMGKRQKNEANEYLMRLQKGRGSREDIEKFKKAIKELPAVLELFDIAENAKRTSIEQLSGDNQAMKLAIRQSLENIKTGLGFDNL